MACRIARVTLVIALVAPIGVLAACGAFGADPAAPTAAEAGDKEGSAGDAPLDTGADVSEDGPADAGVDAAPLELDCNAAAMPVADIPFNGTALPPGTSLFGGVAQTVAGLPLGKLEMGSTGSVWITENLSPQAGTGLWVRFDVKVQVDAGSQSGMGFGLAWGVVPASARDAFGVCASTAEGMGLLVDTTTGGSASGRVARLDSCLTPVTPAATTSVTALDLDPPAGTTGGWSSVDVRITPNRVTWSILGTAMVTGDYDLRAAPTGSQTATAIGIGAQSGVSASPPVIAVHTIKELRIRRCVLKQP